MKPYAKAQTIPLEGMLDRRCKITPDDIVKIREIYAKGEVGQRKLAQMFHISKSYVGFLVNPERARKVKERQKLQWREWHKKRGKEDHAKAVRMTRRYKYGLYKRGIIGQTEKEENNALTEN